MDHLLGMLILFLSVWGNGCAAHSLVINVNHGLEVGKLVNRYALENRYWRNQCGTDIEWKFETRESSGRLPQPLLPAFSWTLYSSRRYCDPN